jgi:hypothetical protein
MHAIPGISWLAVGDWTADRISTTWTGRTWMPSAAISSAVDERWTAAVQRGGRTLFDGPLARLDRCRLSGDRLHLDLSATSYRFFWGTNVSDPSLPDDDRADPLGTSAVVLSADGHLILGRRSPSMALYPGRVHPFGGCVEGGARSDVLAETARELAEEVGLHADDLCDLRLLAVVRDHALAQPEALCLATTRLDRATTLSRLDAAEHSSAWSVPAQPAAVLAALSDPTLTPVAHSQLAAWLHSRHPQSSRIASDSH